MEDRSKGTLSVLLPNYNNELYLKKALDSLFKQTYQDFSIYFVDDGSTDRSIEIAKSYKDERLIIIEKSPNSGIVDTLNAGLGKVQSEYIVRMDGDDWAEPNRLEYLLEFMKSNPEIGVCGSGIQMFGVSEDVQMFPTNSDMLHANLIFGHLTAHPTVIIRTSILHNNGITYKNDFYRLEDYNLFYDLKSYTKFSNLDIILYHYRQEEYNTNSELRNMMKLEYKKMYFKVLAELFSEVNSKDVELHMGLSKKGDLIHAFREYREHSERLILENNKKEIYPLPAFKALIKNHLDSVRFKLIDSKKIGLIPVIQDVFKGELKFLKYYLSANLKKDK